MSSSVSIYTDPDSIKATIDSGSGNAVAYECDYLLSSSNTFPKEVVPAYYNLIYPCDDPDTTAATNSTANNEVIKAMNYIEYKLFESAALAWKIHPDTDGAGCSNPSLEVYNTLLVSVSSLPADQIVSSMDCLSTTQVTEGRCCVVIKSEMTFTPSGGYSELDLIRFVSSQLDSDLLTDGTSYKTLYAGSFVPPQEIAADTLDNSQNRSSSNSGDTDPVADAVISESSNNTGGFTAVGGIVLAGLTIAFIGFVMVLVQRRRRNNFRNRQMDRIEYHDEDDDEDFKAMKQNSKQRTLQAESQMDTVDLNNGDNSTHCGDAFEITVLSDDLDVYTTNTGLSLTGCLDGIGGGEPRVLGGGTPADESFVMSRALSFSSPALDAAKKSGTSIAVRELLAEPPLAPIHCTPSFGEISKGDSYDGGDSWDSSSFTDENSNTAPNSGDGVGNNRRYRGSRGYAFDLGQTFKNEIMGKHNHLNYQFGGNINSNTPNRNRSNSNGSGHHPGTSPGVPNSDGAPTTIEVVPPYPMMEETSDSEADSWAQTDGTVGSLEERLEDITVEI